MTIDMPRSTIPALGVVALLCTGSGTASERGAQPRLQSRPAATPTAAAAAGYGPMDGAAGRLTCGARMLPDGDVCVRIRVPSRKEEEEDEPVFGHMGVQTLPPSGQGPDSDR